MRRQLAAITIGGASLLGGAVGVALGAPELALAQDASGATDGATTTTTPEAGSGTSTTPEAAPDEHAGRVDEVLDGLVADGTLSQEQADKVAEALAAARPEGGPGHGRGGPRLGGGFSLSTVAEALGMTEEEVRTALHDGSTVAELAESKGVDVATVTDALVAAATARIDEAVAAGRLTQERADQLLADLPARIVTLVQEGLPERAAFGPGRGHGHHGDEADDGSSGDATTGDGSTDTTTGS